MRNERTENQCEVPVRRKYWEELSIEEKLEQLAYAVENLHRDNQGLSRVISILLEITFILKTDRLRYR